MRRLIVLFTVLIAFAGPVSAQAPDCEIDDLRSWLGPIVNLWPGEIGKTSGYFENLNLFVDSTRPGDMLRCEPAITIYAHFKQAQVNLLLGHFVDLLTQDIEDRAEVLAKVNEYYRLAAVEMGNVFGKWLCFSNEDIECPEDMLETVEVDGFGIAELSEMLSSLVP